jgi:hypothetical protein
MAPLEQGEGTTRAWPEILGDVAGRGRGGSTGAWPGSRHRHLRLSADDDRRQAVKNGALRQRLERRPEVHFVLLGVHSAEVCPTSNATTRQLLLEIGPEIPTIAQRTGVNIVAGPYVNREHITVAVVEAEKAENVDRFLVESRLHQWNTMRVLPSMPMEEGMRDVQESQSLF